MDLRLGATVPATAEERAAIASVLGPPESGWDGGQRQEPTGTSRSAAAPPARDGTC